MNVLITGASGGIGKQLAKTFGRAGHGVAVHYRTNRDSAMSLVTELKELGGRVEMVQADLSDPPQVTALVTEVVKKWGGLDGLINNAGLARDRSLLKMSSQEWREVMDVNLSGAFWCLQAAARQMVFAKQGFIINIGSILGVKGAVGCANYVASKAGLIGLTKAAALELGRFNVRVNAVLPGFHPTAMSETIPPAQRERVMSHHVLGKSTDTKDLCRFVLNLAETSTVSGQIFNVDSRLL